MRSLDCQDFRFLDERNQIFFELDVSSFIFLYWPHELTEVSVDLFPAGLNICSGCKCRCRNYWFSIDPLSLSLSPVKQYQKINAASWSNLLLSTYLRPLSNLTVHSYPKNVLHLSTARVKGYPKGSFLFLSSLVLTTNFHRYCQIFTNIYKYWQILTNIDKYWQILTHLTVMRARCLNLSLKSLPCLWSPTWAPVSTKVEKYFQSTFHECYLVPPPPSPPQSTGCSSPHYWARLALRSPCCNPLPSYPYHLLTPLCKLSSI